MRLVEAQHVAVAISLVVQAFAHDDIGHGDQRRGIGRRLDEDVFLGKRGAGARTARIDADDANALLLRLLEILLRAGAERAVGGTPTPHHDQLRVHVVGRLAAGGLVVGLGAEGHAHGEDLGLGRHVRPQLGAAAELVEEALRDTEAVQHRGVARARAVEDGGIAMRLANTQQLGSDMAQRLVPRDALELPRVARSDAAHRIFQPVGMVDALDLPDTAGAGVERRQLGLPARRVGGDFYDTVVDNVGIDHAATAAIVAAGAGDDGLAGAAPTPRLLVDGLIRHGPHLACAARVAHSMPQELARLMRRGRNALGQDARGF